MDFSCLFYKLFRFCSTPSRLFWWLSYLCYLIAEKWICFWCLKILGTFPWFSGPFFFLPARSSWGLQPYISCLISISFDDFFFSSFRRFLNMILIFTLYLFMFFCRFFWLKIWWRVVIHKQSCGNGFQEMTIWSMPLRRATMPLDLSWQKYWRVKEGCGKFWDEETIWAIVHRYECFVMY